MPRDILAFFQSYRDAFNRLDGRAVAGLYAEPSGIAQDGAYTHWPRPQDVEKNMVALCSVYRDRGFVQASFEPGPFIAQGPCHAVADILWRIDWAGTQQAPWHFKTTYNLVRAAHGWHILLCTAYAEAALHKEHPAAP